MESSNRNFKIAGLLVLVVGLMAIGDAGAQDPYADLLPSVRWDVPGLSQSSAKTMLTTFSFPLVGVDASSPTGRPVKYRYVLVSAQYDTTNTGEPLYVRTPFEYNLYGAEVVPRWDDPVWGEWIDYPAEPEVPMVGAEDLIDGAYYLLAMQVMNADGAVSLGLDYQIEVVNIRIKAGGYLPEVVLAEPFLGTAVSMESFDEIAGGQPLNFSWTANADAYGGVITSYRHGWDLIDPNDPNDPGWAVPPGLTQQNLFAAERAFQDGLHVFYLRVEDDSEGVRLLKWTLQVVPFVDRSHQLPLLVIDQVYDPEALTNNWPDQNGTPRNRESFRNAYWHFLAEGSGGVSGINWDRDRKDHTENVDYSDLVKYKAVLCYAQFNDANQIMFQKFRPRDGVDQFVWLAPYQERGGNFFLVGGSSMESFIEARSNYMIPMIFESRQPTMILDGQTYITGFGTTELPDGTVVQRGPRLYPYATAGIAAIDWTSPGTKTIYGRTRIARFERTSNCSGLKGLTLDPDFKSLHGIGPGVIADTMFTDPVIDWQDVVNLQSGTLELLSDSYQFPFRNDEFYDINITTRPEYVDLQDCDAVEAPWGRCVEPMFRGISRMDWIREIRYAEGDLDWPQSRYSDFDLDKNNDGCGNLGLTSYEGRERSSSRAHGHNYGFLSYKTIQDKPVRKADVYWGFDPYRFDPNETKKAVRWVLQYFGLAINP